MKQVTIIATSLNEESKSQTLAQIFQEKLAAQDIACHCIDLRRLSLPFAGSADSWDSPDAQSLKESVSQSSHIVFAVPIYCYDVNAAAKNVIELIGRSFSKKIISFICSAGGSSSYMSVMGMANHLMLDFRSIIVPRFLYVDPTGWQEDKPTPAIEERMQQLIDDMQEIQIQAQTSA